ncbi:energy transducer TonB [Pleionea sediminis]|uniref:energy transducer TonB n=1 Tax=Pleionea sediminis TaxID=2569479 RepID=UPI00118490DB|nr:energy transducer TonB [Pleionea sediminis]
MKILLVLSLTILLAACQSTSNGNTAFSGKKKLDDCGLIDESDRVEGDNNEAIPCVVVTPFYPRDLAIKRISGHVKFGFLLNDAGKVENVRVIESVPQGKFDYAALKALSEWTFKLPNNNGKLMLDKELFYTMEFKIDG